MNKRQGSIAAFARSREVIPGGVNSPVRAFRGVGGEPVFIRRGAGARIWDIDDNCYLDFVGSWGALILGHAFPQVIDAVREAVADGTSFGAPTERETVLAQTIVDMVPSIEMVRLVNSGTEATMSAVRLARAATGRDLIVKFEGCYHGHGDGFLIAAGSGATTLGVPDSPGVPRGVAQCTLSARYNDIDSVERLFAAHDHQIAAVIVEPVAGNMGVVLPREGFLQALRSLTARHGALLIFDEVMSGFRLAPAGAQQRYGVQPDLTTLGKIVGGGLPIGAYGGRRDIMSQVAPAGPMYQAGTLSGNPAAVAAGLATLRQLQRDPQIYDRLESATEMLANSLVTLCRSRGISCVCNRVGSMLCLFFTDRDTIDNYEDARSCDTDRFARFFHAMLNAGVYLPPSQFESWFVSAAHGDADIQTVCAAAESALDRIGG